VDEDVDGIRELEYLSRVGMPVGTFGPWRSWNRNAVDDGEGFAAR
jgi:hypothetical protein